jgi:hypothetical protein
MLESSKNASEANVVIPLFLCREQSFFVAVVWIDMMNTVVLVHMMNTDEKRTLTSFLEVSLYSVQSNMDLTPGIASILLKAGDSLCFLFLSKGLGTLVECFLLQGFDLLSVFCARGSSPPESQTS